MASVRQANFIHSLMVDVGASHADVDALDFSMVTNQQVSEMINGLKAAIAENKQRGNGSVGEVPEGIHRILNDDGSLKQIIKVQVAVHGSGQKYGKRLNLDTGEWTYGGKNALRGLSDDTKLTLQEAQKFGQLYGMCLVCGATLTDETSISLGIGPVCRSRL